MIWNPWQAYLGGPSSPAVVVQSSGDVDVLSHELIASRQSTLKALQELDDSLMKEKDKIIDDNAIVYDNIYSLEGQITALNLEITEINKDIEVLKAHKHQLKMEKAHYIKEGQTNRNKLREMKLVLRKN